MNQLVDFYRYSITIEYLGTAFVGWQRQCNAISIQQILEDSTVYTNLLVKK